MQVLFIFIFIYGFTFGYLLIHPPSLMLNVIAVMGMDTRTPKIIALQSSTALSWTQTRMGSGMNVMMTMIMMASQITKTTADWCLIQTKQIQTVHI